MILFSARQVAVLEALDQAGPDGEHRWPSWHGSTLRALLRRGLIDYGEIRTSEVWFGCRDITGASRRLGPEMHHPIQQLYRITELGRREIELGRRPAIRLQKFTALVPVTNALLEDAVRLEEVA